MTGRTGRLRWLRWVLLGLGLAALITVAILWLMFQHIPSWYRPMAVVPASDADQRIRNDWLGAIGTLREKLLQEKQSFEFSASQDQLNAWLAVRETIRPQTRNWLPPALSDPFVLIEQDGLRLAATYRSGGVKTVLSARLHIGVEAGGIRVKLTEVAGGSLEMPEAWVRQRLSLLDGRVWPSGKKSPYQLGGPPLPPLAGLSEGIVLPNTWVWEEEQLQLPFRITGLRFESGALVVSLQPLPR